MAFDYIKRRGIGRCPTDRAPELTPETHPERYVHVERTPSRSSYSSPKLSSTQQVLATLVGIWCAVLILNTEFTIPGGQESTNAFCLLLLLLPLLLIGPKRGFSRGIRLFTLARRNGKALLVWTFVGCAALSAPNSGAAFRSFGFLAATIIGFIAFGELYSRLGTHGFLYLMRVYSIVGTVVVLTMLFLNGFTGAIMGRLSLGPGDHPNHFGLVCWSIMCAALAWDSIVLKSSLPALMLFFMSQAQSRTALVAGAASLMIYPVLRYRRFWQRALLPGVALTLLLAVNIIWPGRIMEGASSMLMLNDKYRGVGSGLAGRTDQLPVALDLISEKPLLGHGYHVQNQYLPTEALLQIGGFHNGYIALIVEIGFLGAVPLFCLIGIGALLVWRKVRISSASALEFSIVIGYLVYVTAQPYLINQTNPASAFFWAVVCGALVWKRPKIRRVPLPELSAVPVERLRPLYPSERRAQLLSATK